MDRDFVETWSRSFLDAWNAHDPDAVVSLASEELALDDPALPQTLHGHEGMRRFAEATFTAFPDFRIEPVDSPYLAPDGPRALGRWRMTGTMEGPWEFMGLPASGRPMDIRGVDVWEFDGERLRRWELVYDGLELAQQLAGGR